jgi:hypothetical protein
MSTWPNGPQRIPRLNATNSSSEGAKRRARLPRHLASQNGAKQFRSAFQNKGSPNSSGWPERGFGQPLSPDVMFTLSLIHGRRALSSCRYSVMVGPLRKMRPPTATCLRRVALTTTHKNASGASQSNGLLSRFLEGKREAWRLWEKVGSAT